MNTQRAVELFLHAVTHEYGYSAHTVRAYRQDLTSFMTSLTQSARDRVEELSLQDFRAWVWQRQQAGRAPRTIARGVATMKSFGVWLEREGHVLGNPAARLRAPKPGASLPRVLSREQIRQLLQRLRAGADTGDPIMIRNAAVCELLYATAMRVSELCALQHADVDMHERTVKVRGKGNVHRVIPFGLPAQRALQRWLDHGRSQCIAPEQRDSLAVFVTSAGRQVTSEHIYKMVAHELRAFAGSGPHGPHVFRHTAATHMLDGGADLRVVQEYLGHTSLESTQVYTHVSTEQLAGRYRNAHPRA